MLYSYPFSYFYFTTVLFLFSLSVGIFLPLSSFLLSSPHFYYTLFPQLPRMLRDATKLKISIVFYMHIPFPTGQVTERLICIHFPLLFMSILFIFYCTNGHNSYISPTETTFYLDKGTWRNHLLMNRNHLFIYWSNKKIFLSFPLFPFIVLLLPYPFFFSFSFFLNVYPPLAFIFPCNHISLNPSFPSPPHLSHTPYYPTFLFPIVPRSPLWSLRFSAVYRPVPTCWNQWRPRMLLDSTLLYTQDTFSPPAKEI